MANPLTLRVHKDGRLIETREFDRDVVKIGRLSTAHLCIDDDRVSRIHAVIEVGADGALSIIDMGSVEGTFVNGKRVSKSALVDGDRIRMGGVELEVVLGGAEAAAPAPAAPASAPAAAPTPEAVAAVVAGSMPGVPPEVLAAAQQAAAQVIAAAQAAAQAAQPNVVPQGNVAAIARPQVGGAVPTPAVAPAAPAAPVAAPATGAAAGAPVDAPAAPAPAEAAAPVQLPAAAPAPAAAPRTVAEAWARAGITFGDVAPVARRAVRLPRPEPLPRGFAGRSVELDVRCFWGDQQIAMAHFDVQSKVTVGPGPEADFQVEPAHLEGDAFPLLVRGDDGWALRFGGTMEGEWIGPGGVHRLADLAKSGKARRSDEPGFYELPIAVDEAAWVDVGHLRFDVCFRPKPKPAVLPWAQKLDYNYLNVFAVVFFLGLGTIITATNKAWDADVYQDDLHANQTRWAKTLFEAPKRNYNPFLAKLDLEAPKDPGEAAAKAAGDEGKMGKREAPKRDTRSAPRAIDPNDKEQVKNQGILAMLGKGQNAGLSTIFGTKGLGGDLKGAIGGITGKSVGDAQGFGGLGLKGAGTGGGGIGNTIGVGDVGTRGRGGGQGSFGKGVGGLGKKGSANVQISSSEAKIVGYDKELVRRVVHAHHAQLRYCYESELVRNPDMSGKVTIKWVIGPQGTVTQVNTLASTLGNKRVESCINARVKSWNFPPPKDGGIAIVTYPFVFRPSGG